MFKKFMMLCCLMTMCQTLSVYAAENEFDSSMPRHSRQLTEIIETIQKLPEARKLIATIQQEGRISILCNKGITVCQQFGACWDPNRRVIFVNMTPGSSKGELIGSILFELQNAAVNAQLLHYDDLASQGRIQQENYVRAIEYLEYQNSLRAHELAGKGIRSGLYPRAAQLPIFDSFEEHYRVQKESGHSAWIAYNYKQLAPQR